MKFIRLFSLCLIGSCFLIWTASCNRKASQVLEEKREQAVATDTATQVVTEENLSDCIKFNDIAKSSKALEQYVIYRDFFKLNQYDEAFPYWRKVYQMAPAADGKRYVVYTDGVYLYQDKLQKQSDSVAINAIIDTILSLYDEAIECYPKYDGYLTGRKAFDVYYQYPHTYSDEQKFSLFEHSFTILGDEAPSFIINPFTALLRQQFLRGNIDTVRTRKWALKLQKLIPAKVDQNPNAQDWKIVEEYALEKLKEFESIKGFYDCSYYIENYLEPYESAKNIDCETALLTYSKLRWGGCDVSDPALIRIEQQLKDSCSLAPGGSSSLAKDAFAYLKEGNYNEAINAFKEAITYAETDDRKATYSLMIAKVYFAYLRNFPKARTYALQASEYKENWGEPFLLIGKLYASSGPLCGPGTGWDSQVVTWVAIDKWQYAKDIDPEAATEAQKLINEYWQYMPTKEDIAMRLHKVGDTFRVGCWIQETTTIRASRNTR